MIDEIQKAKDYWSSVDFTVYHRDGSQREIIVAAIRELGRDQPIRSVLEFGCNVGRTLHLLTQRLAPAPRVVGLDINEAALADGRKVYGLDLRTGSEEVLGKIGEDEFDCAFTVSVFDHMAERDQVKGAIQELARIAKRYLLFLEPFGGTEGRARHTETAVQYNYYWDYPRLISECGLRLVNDMYHPLGYETTFRTQYRLYVVALKQGSPGLPLLISLRKQLGRVRWMLRHHPAVRRLLG